MTPPVIRIENLSKRFLIGHQRGPDDGLRHLIESVVRSPLAALRKRKAQMRSQVDEFWALRDINMEIHPGEVVGILGRNGAGKSTLLKILSRITQPTGGRVQLHGRVASLLEVGTGFHQELTGRENIFLNGAILGMRREEIRKKFDEIVEFAEIERFLDTPVKRYSSGMYVRLAFAVAAHLEPDILIIDEVLAVGDMAFQKKCLGHMERQRDRSRTVLFVSHNLAAVESLCTRAVVLNHGKSVFSGTARDATRYFLESMSGKEESAHADIVDLTRLSVGSMGARPALRELRLLGEDGKPLGGSLPAGAPLKAAITVELETPTGSLDVELGFSTQHGARICTAHSAYEPNWSKTRRGGQLVFSCDIASLPLLPGEYVVSVALEIALHQTERVEVATHLTVVSADFYGTGVIPAKGTFLVQNRWSISHGQSRGYAVEAISAGKPRAKENA